MGAEYAGPVDVAADIAEINGWNPERKSTDEVSFFIGQYQFNFYWLQDYDALSVSCGFLLDAPSAQHAEIKKLTAIINDHLWVGHFGFWAKENIVLFRHAHILPVGVDFPPEVCARLIELAHEICDCYVFAFHGAMNGMSAEESFVTAQAMDASGNA